MRIGIITAMPEETRAIARAVGKTGRVRINGLRPYQGDASGHEIVIAEAGMGFNNASSTAEKLIQAARLDLLVSAGFCGGIAEELRVGDVVVAKTLTIVTGAVLEDVSVEMAPVCHTLARVLAEEGNRVFNGLFVSTATIMRKLQLAMILPADAPCPVVEMESAAIARIAAANRIPFIGLRTVSDPYNEELDFSLDEFCDETMKIHIPRVLLTIVGKPRIIPQLIRLARNSRVAAESLSAAIKSTLKHL